MSKASKRRKERRVEKLAALLKAEKAVPGKDIRDKTRQTPFQKAMAELLTSWISDINKRAWHTLDVDGQPFEAAFTFVDTQLEPFFKSPHMADSAFAKAIESLRSDLHHVACTEISRALNLSTYHLASRLPKVPNSVQGSRD